MNAQNLFLSLTLIIPSTSFCMEQAGTAEPDKDDIHFEFTVPGSMVRDVKDIVNGVSTGLSQLTHAFDNFGINPDSNDAPLAVSESLKTELEKTNNEITQLVIKQDSTNANLYNFMTALALQARINTGRWTEEEEGQYTELRKEQKKTQADLFAALTKCMIEYNTYMTTLIEAARASAQEQGASETAGHLAQLKKNSESFAAYMTPVIKMLTQQDPQ